MKRTRHQLAPAVPVQQVIDRAVAGRVPDRFLVGRSEIVDVQHLAGARRFGKTREQGLFFRQGHVLVLAYCAASSSFLKLSLLMPWVARRLGYLLGQASLPRCDFVWVEALNGTIHMSQSETKI